MSRPGKTIPEEYQIKDKVELINEKEQIIFWPIESPRENPGKKMMKNNDDEFFAREVFEFEP